MQKYNFSAKPRHHSPISLPAGQYFRPWGDCRRRPRPSPGACLRQAYGSYTASSPCGRPRACFPRSCRPRRACRISQTPACRPPRSWCRCASTWATAVPCPSRAVALSRPAHTPMPARCRCHSRSGSSRKSRAAPPTCGGASSRPRCCVPPSRPGTAA